MHINKIMMILGLSLFACILSMQQLRTNQEALAARLAPGILRLHILADTNFEKDQQVKLEIRSLLLDYLSSHLPEGCKKGETISFLSRHRQEIETLASDFLRAKEFPYSASLSLSNDYFPTRVYDQLVFPCGYYDAARITLGTGQGRNWWCILYPKFCFSESTLCSIPRESKAALAAELKQDDALALENHRPVIKIRFFLFPSFSRSDSAVPSKSAKIFTPPSPGH